MTTLRDALADYLDLRRSLGFGLVRDAKLLTQFLDYLDEHGIATVTTDAAVAWARLPAGGSPGWWGMRLRMVRAFAAYLNTLDPAVEVPPRGILPGHGRRAVPYLYSPADLAALFAQAQRLRTPLRTATIRTLIGLLAVTGMRIGEVIALDDNDLDPTEGLLVVRRAKGGGSRLIPLHPTTLTALTDYRTLRDQVFTRPVSEALLVSNTGTRLLNYNVGQTFAKLVRRAGLSSRTSSCRPRPHDLRHSFAVATLLDWYRDGGDVTARLPLLSTYLGHVAPAHTYWYLQAAPELLAEAAHRLHIHPAGRR
jgi:integrase/recombinase XerD